MTTIINMLAILVAAQLGASVPESRHLTDLRGLFSFDDVPWFLLDKGTGRWTAYTRTTVRDDGTLENCTVEVPNGEPRLDPYTCTLIKRRLKPRAATWTDGTPVYSVLRFPITYWIVDNIPSEDERKKAIVPDLQISGYRLPDGQRLVDLTLEVWVDDRGRITTCRELPPLTSNRKKTYPELSIIACADASKALTLSPPADRFRKPVRSVQSITVRFNYQAAVFIRSSPSLR